MPHIAYGDLGSKKGSANFASMNFDYDYPQGLKLTWHSAS